VSLVIRRVLYLLSTLVHHHSLLFVFLQSGIDVSLDDLVTKRGSGKAERSQKRGGGNHRRSRCWWVPALDVLVCLPSPIHPRTFQSIHLFFFSRISLVIFVPLLLA
jgi:hypothetical protein